MNDKCCVEWCNRVRNESGKGYCRRHYDQIRQYGYILEERTRNDPNRIVIEDNIAKIIITDKKDNYICEAIIDSEDVDRIKEHKWTTNGKYIRCFFGRKPIYLHRFIMNYDGELDVDHINRNRLDNRKANLRIVTRSINVSNKDCKNYKLITERKLSKPWCVTFNLKGHSFIKYVATEEEAKQLVHEKRIELGIIKE